VRYGQGKVVLSGLKVTPTAEDIENGTVEIPQENVVAIPGIS
jgi:hypothetical protein